MLRRRDHSNIDMLRSAAANRRDRAILQRAQHLRLHGRRHVANLIEKKRAAVGFAKSSCARLHCAGERAAHVAKQFTFQQFGRNRRAVHGDERTPCALTVTMDRAGNEFFSSARFAEDKHRRITGRSNPDEFLHRSHRCARTDKILRAGEVDFLCDCARTRQCAREHAANVIATDRLGKMIERAKFHRFDCVCGIGERRENHDRRGCGVGH